MNTNTIILAIITSISLALLGSVLWYNQTKQTSDIDSFEDCVQAGYPILESYPPQCRTPDGQIFTQDIGNELDKTDLIQVASPRPGEIVRQSLTISGQARGTWFFEASFPIYLEDNAGIRQVSTFAETQHEWMTEKFVPFETTLAIPSDMSGPATLVLEKANPSGLPEHDDALRIPITITPTAETLSIQVYFSNNTLLQPEQDECATTFPVTRDIPRTTAVARAALEQLLSGPTPAEQAEGYSTSLNPNITIQSLTIKNSTAEADFSKTLEQSIAGSCQVTSIRNQITQTLQQFPTVDNVTISIDGRTEDILQP